jgi:hypothetical protein
MTPDPSFDSVRPTLSDLTKQCVPSTVSESRIDFESINEHDAINIAEGTKGYFEERKGTVAANIREFPTAKDPVRSPLINSPLTVMNPDSIFDSVPGRLSDFTKQCVPSTVSESGIDFESISVCDAIKIAEGTKGNFEDWRVIVGPSIREWSIVNDPMI